MTIGPRQYYTGLTPASMVVYVCNLESFHECLSIQSCIVAGILKLDDALLGILELDDGVDV